MARAGAQLLSGAISVGNKWAVALGTFPFGDPGPCGATNNKDCVIFEGTPSVLKPNVEIAGTNLVRTFDPGSGVLQLKGTAIATGSGFIKRVDTEVLVCPNTVSASQSCAFNEGGAPTFTEALAPAKFTQIQVGSGQIIEVTVTISFS